MRGIATEVRTDQFSHVIAIVLKMCVCVCVCGGGVQGRAGLDRAEQGARGGVGRGVGAIIIM